MKTEIITCDIKKCGRIATHIGKNISVIFLTEQTEGRSVDPHFSLEKIDLCDVCMDYALRGNSIYGSGAQGNNKYWFKNIEQK